MKNEYYLKHFLNLFEERLWIGECCGKTGIHDPPHPIPLGAEIWTVTNNNESGADVIVRGPTTMNRIGTCFLLPTERENTRPIHLPHPDRPILPNGEFVGPHLLSVNLIEDDSSLGQRIYTITQETGIKKHEEKISLTGEEFAGLAAWWAGREAIREGKETE